MAPNGNTRWPHTALLTRSTSGPERPYRWPPKAQILGSRCDRASDFPGELALPVAVMLHPARRRAPAAKTPKWKINRAFICLLSESEGILGTGRASLASDEIRRLSLR